MNISQLHPNRREHNWLIYDIGDRWLKTQTGLYRGTIFDLGCGDASFKRWFLQYADHYIGVDWCNAFHNSRADIVADLNEPLPIDDEAGETVLSLSVMEHLSDPQIMLNEGFRIMKPGGALILQVPWQWQIHESPCDYFRYTPYGLRLMLERAGFVEIEVKPQAGFFSMLTMKLNYFSLRFVRGPRLLRVGLRAVLSVFWFLGQKAAPYLDKLDRNWENETTGYFVTAKKSILE